jgi:hypothetical protein
MTNQWQRLFGAKRLRADRALLHELEIQIRKAERASVPPQPIHLVDEDMRRRIAAAYGKSID